MITHPFGTDPVPEIPLPNAPLGLVIAQVQFPPVVTISDGGAFIGPFQEALRREYPILRGEEEIQVVIGPSGPLPGGKQRVWRLQQEEHGWQVSLAPNFVALSTERYSSRAELLARWAVVLEALHQWLEPRICDRLGIRYVSRVTDHELLDRLPELLRAEVVGVGGVDLGDDTVSYQHAISDAVFDQDDGSALHARWGLLPPNGTFDPALPPLPGKSFTFDLDVFTTRPGDFSPVRLRDASAEFCERQYRFFRWAVTGKYLRAFGGQL